MRSLKFFLLPVVVFLIFFNTTLYSEVVKKVEISGNERITDETIIVFGDIELGKNYQSNDVNKLIKKLYETTFFSDLNVELSNNILKIIVNENPIIDEIIFNGEKSKKHKERLKEMLQLREKASFIKNNIKNEINLITAYYRMQGYYFVKIETEIEELKSNKVNIIYAIDKGKRAKIAKIFFLGDKKIRERRLRDIITSQENMFWKFISRNVYLSKERIELDKRLLSSYYKNKGYYEVDVKSTNVEYSEGEGFVLTYNINAGPRYKFKKVSANIEKTLDATAFFSLEDEFNKLVGNYYSQEKLKLVLDKIDNLSKQKELQFINHNVLETLDKNGIEVKINIFEGEKVIIERINIIGNSVTNDSVIRSALIVDEGDPFSTLLVSKSINEIKSRQIFSKVEEKILPGSEENLKVLEITVEEQATGEIMAGAGFGTDGGSFQLSVKENNWLGKGIRLNTAFNLSANAVSGTININNPNYKFSGNALSMGGDISSSDKTGTSGFKSDRTGIMLGTGWEQYEGFYITPKLTSAIEKIEVSDTASTEIQKMKGNYFNADLGYGLTLDRRNQSYRPTKGHKVTFKQTLPIIQDSSSILNSIDFNKYNSFGEDIIGKLRIHAKAIHGVDDNVRITDRLYVPRSRLRGFDTRKVGPVDGKDFVGGNYFYSLGVEAQLPNLLPESYKTDVVVFLDAANIWGVDYSSGVDETNKLRSAVGISSSIFTIVGPLMFTVAKDITKAANDETEIFNFRLGTTF